MLIAYFPLHQQCAAQPTLGLHKTVYHPLPLGSRRWEPATDPLKGLFPNGTCLDAQIDAQERMPPARYNRRVEPVGIQSPISQHQHLPVDRHTALQVL